MIFSSPNEILKIENLLKQGMSFRRSSLRVGPVSAVFLNLRVACRTDVQFAKCHLVGLCCCLDIYHISLYLLLAFLCNKRHF